MKVTPKSSKNYEWFKFLSNNRKISLTNIKQLEREFDKYGNITEIIPIVVNTNGFIIEGQHRFLICQKREMEVHYHEVDAQKEITPAINSKKKPWSPMDYINFFAAYKPEYEVLRKFMKDNETTYPIASAVLYANLNRRHVATMNLHEGTLQVTPFIKGAQSSMDVINEVIKKMGSYMSERYARSLVRCLYMESFDLNRFMMKLDMVMKNNPDLPNPRLAGLTDCLRNIESIYNYHAGLSSQVVLFH